MIGVLFLMNTMLCASGQIFLVSPSIFNTTAAACHDDSMPSSPPHQQHQPSRSGHECCLTGHNHAAPLAAVQITRLMVEVESISPILVQRQTSLLTLSEPPRNDTGPPPDDAVLRI